MDDGAGGDFSALTGLVADSLGTSYLIQAGIAKGMTY
jgi:hypothetical protein